MTNGEVSELTWLADCDGHTISFLTKLAFHDVSFSQGLTLIGIEIPLVDPDAHNQLGTSEERATLLEREEAITKSLSPWKAMWVSHTTWKGVRTVYYAANRTKEDMPAIREAVKSQLPEYRDLEISAYSWEQYDEWLYPRDSDFRWASESDYCEVREKRGDDLDVERQVDHWLFFTTQGDRENAKKRALELGFKVLESSDEPANDSEHPWELNVAHFSDVRVNTMFKFVTELTKLARSFGGIHDGWGAEIQTRQ